MKKPSAVLVRGGFFLGAATILTGGWWLFTNEKTGHSGGPNTSVTTAQSPAEPVIVEEEAPELPATHPSFVGKEKEPAHCALHGDEIPTIDTPFGIHLFANTPRGVVTMLPAAEIVNRLGLPQSSIATATGLKTGDPSAKADAAAANANPTEANGDAQEDVQSIVMILEEYRRAFGAMPNGELNDEIVRRLQGENPRGVAVLPKQHPAINADGEILDRWGTPFRFHPESATEMTVRSAGPDKRMWTSDDVLSEERSTAMVQM